MNGARTDSALGVDDLDRLDFAKSGLLPAIVQHAETGSVLMLGYMNREALLQTLDGGRVVFFSRSRQRLWTKGESSNHFLDVVSAHTDCDRDCLLILALPHGPVCHTGTLTCFGDSLQPRAAQLAFLRTLEDVIERRIGGPPAESYTARLFAQGTRRVAQKVGEEALEVALAAASGSEADVVSESADLLFHLLVLLRARGVTLDEVIAELAHRHERRSAPTGHPTPSD